MKKLGLLPFVLLSSFAFAQNSRSDGVVFSRSGAPAPSASIAVCSPVAITAASEVVGTVTITSTLNPAQGSTVQIVGMTPTAYNGSYTVLTTSGTNFTYTNPTQGLGAGTVFGTALVVSTTPCSPLAPLCASFTDTTCTSPNPVTADGLGNYSFYVKPGRYTQQFYGSGLTARLQPDQVLACDPSVSCTLTGPITITGALTAGSVNGTCFADSQSPSDYGAKVNACVTSFDTIKGGTIVMRSCGAYATQIVIDRPVILKGQAAGVNQRGCLLNWTGGASQGIFVDGTGSAGANGVILQDFSLENTGTGTVGIDIDNGVYGILLKNLNIVANVAWSTAAIRAGNRLTGGAVNHVGLSNVYCADEKLCLLNLRAFYTHLDADTQLVNSGFVLTSGTAEIQIGDATHKSLGFMAVNTQIAPLANTTGVLVLNSDVATFTNVHFEIDGTGYAIDAPSTATSPGSINVQGGRVIGSSFTHASTWVFDSNFSGAQWNIEDMFATGFGASTFFFRNQSVQSAVLRGLTADTNTIADSTSYTNVVTFGHIFSGTANPTNQFKANTFEVDSLASGNTMEIGAHDPAGRVAVMRSPSLANAGAQFGTSSNHEVDFITNNTIRRAISNGGLAWDNSLNRVFVASDFTTANNTNLQTITGLAWATPFITGGQSWNFHCSLAYSQATAAVSDAFGIQVATIAPTNVFAKGRVDTSATAVASGVLATLATTTATNILTFTPSATATVFGADLDGTLELPQGANQVNIMVSTTNGADAVTVKRGSYCILY